MNRLSSHRDMVHSLFSLFYTMVFWRAVGTKDFPVAHSQSLQNSLPNLTTKNRIRVHRSHQNRRILVILRLDCGKAVDVNVNISGKSDVILIIDQNNFTG